MYKNASDEDRAGLRDAMCRTWSNPSELTLVMSIFGFRDLGFRRIFSVWSLGRFRVDEMDLLQDLSYCFAMLSPRSLPILFLRVPDSML